MQKKIVPELFRNFVYKDYLKLIPYGFTKNTNSILLFQDYELKNHINKFFKNIKFHVTDIQIIRNKDVLNINVSYYKVKFYNKIFDLNLFSKLNFYKYIYLKNLISYHSFNRHKKFKKLFTLSSGKQKYYTIKTTFAEDKLFFKSEVLYNNLLYRDEEKLYKKQEKPYVYEVKLQPPINLLNNSITSLEHPIKHSKDYKFWRKYNLLKCLYYINPFKKNRVRTYNYTYKIKNDPYPILENIKKEKKKLEIEDEIKRLKENEDSIQNEYLKLSKKLYLKYFKKNFKEYQIYIKDLKTEFLKSLKDIQKKLKKEFKKKLYFENKIPEKNLEISYFFDEKVTYSFLIKNKKWFKNKQEKISRKFYQYLNKKLKVNKLYFNFEYFIYQLYNLNFIYNDYFDYFPVYKSKLKSTIFYDLNKLKIKKPVFHYNLNFSKNILLNLSKYILKKKKFKYILILKIIKKFLKGKKNIKLNFYLILYINFLNLQIYLYYKYLIYKLKTKWGSIY